FWKTIYDLYTYGIFVRLILSGLGYDYGIKEELLGIPDYRKFMDEFQSTAPSILTELILFFVDFLTPLALASHIEENQFSFPII
ncbi:hypothetical protein ACJX0J_006636, partial [Zea mays]